jgi:peptidoglycan L-alanyl-D-glutamate endopeptidase CwlK
VGFIAELIEAIIAWIARGDDAAPEPAASDGAMHSRFGGRAWRYDEDGVHADGHVWRTAGEPATCRAIVELYGTVIDAAARRHGVNAALIVMTIATEVGFARAEGFTGAKTFRWEAHVPNRDVTPPFKGTYSAGPMQVLATTARGIVREMKLDYDPIEVAPALRTRPVTAPVSLPLYDPALSIDIGAAVIRRQMRLTGDDPILVAAAYNSGGIYRSRSNAWRLRSHGDHLDRAARWYGDACAVLRTR